MSPEDLAAAMEVDPFRPVCLELADGARVGVETPYLTFVQRHVLHVARATLGTSDRAELALIPLADIRSVSR